MGEKRRWYLGESDFAHEEETQEILEAHAERISVLLRLLGMFEALGAPPYTRPPLPPYFLLLIILSRVAYSIQITKIFS